jgi:hypothetical protein
MMLATQRHGDHSDAMSAGKAAALHSLLERLLERTPDYDNFVRLHCFPVNSRWLPFNAHQGKFCSPISL